jgi:TRAP-type C4-dicarboxylate transport system substrate-binding protein
MMHARIINACTLLLACTLAPSAAADPIVLRMATPAPDGTAWARELKAFSREVAATTDGAVQVKWYLGGVAGDEVEIGERIRRGQLDGLASGGMLCERLAPTMRALHIPGLFADRAAAAYVTKRLFPLLEQETLRAGFVLIAHVTLGPTVVFTRMPVHTVADLRKVRLWRWDLDDVGRAVTQEMGLQLVPGSLEEAGRAYDQGRIDGFLSIPTAALAFQWSAQASYLLNLQLDFLEGCLLVADRAFDELPLEAQREVRSAAVKLQARLDAVSRQQDEALLSGLFARQGLKLLPLTDSMRSEFFERARAARERLGDKLVPKALLVRVLEELAEYRVEHPSR